MDLDRFLILLRALNQHQVDYVLVGGAAVNLHGIVRATEDIDLFIRPERENVERLKQALRTVWDDPDIDQITAEDLGGAYPTVRYGPPGESFAVDILSRLGSALDFDDLEVETIQMRGVEIRVATPTTLYRMKRDTVRPIDRADAAALRDQVDVEEE